MRCTRRNLISCLCCLIITFCFYLIIVSFTSREPELKREPENFDQDVRAKLSYDNSVKSMSYHGSQNAPIIQIKTTFTPRQNLMDYFNSQPRPTIQDFQNCSMSTCFDFSRCLAERPMRVHVVPSSRPFDANVSFGENNIIYQNILNIIKSSKYFEPDPNKACIFVREDDTLDRDPLSQSFRPNLAGLFNQDNLFGMNHLVFNLYSGTWPDYKSNDFAGLQLGAVILAKASSSASFYRKGFDISLPLFSHLHPTYENKVNLNSDALYSTSERNRTYFLTFKGKRYVFGSGSDTRNNLYHIDNRRDVIMLTTCRHGKKWRDSSDSRCIEEEERYSLYDYDDLMKDSIFCLTPRGRRLGSFRFLEALNHGCIPVVLSDGWIKPFDELIDWKGATIQYGENLVLQVPDMLRDINKKTVINMRTKCFDLYKKYFSTTQQIILTTLNIIERRIRKVIDHPDYRKQLMN